MRQLARCATGGQDLRQWDGAERLGASALVAVHSAILRLGLVEMAKAASDACCFRRSLKAGGTEAPFPIPHGVHEPSAHEPKNNARTDCTDFARISPPVAAVFFRAMPD